MAFCDQDSSIEPLALESPERTLLVRVLAQAITDLFQNEPGAEGGKISRYRTNFHNQIVGEAIDWFLCDDKGPFSLLWLCQELGFCHEPFRALALLKLSGITH